MLYSMLMLQKHQDENKNKKSETPQNTTKEEFCSFRDFICGLFCLGLKKQK